MPSPNTTYVLEGYYYNGGGILTDPVSPTVTLIDPNDTAIVHTPLRVSLGIFSYSFAIPSMAVTGIWLAQWGGDIEGVPTFGIEAFFVSAATDIPLITYIEHSKQYLYTSTHEARDKVNALVSSSATSFTLTYGNDALQPGTRISCGLEDMYVWSVSGNAPTVERGQFGTTAAEHASGSVVYFSPKFSNAEILREINNEILSLSAAGLYRIETVDIATSPVLTSYPLDGFSANYEVLEVRARNIGPQDSWPVVENWTQLSSASTSDFSSGYGLQLGQGVPVPSTLHVIYKVPFTTISDLTQPVAAITGLDVTQLDMPLIGAAIRLTAGREIKRNFDEWQGETRRAGEVPAGANSAAPRNLMALRQQRIREELARQHKRFAPKLKRERLPVY